MENMTLWRMENMTRWRMKNMTNPTPRKHGTYASQPAAKNHLTRVKSKTTGKAQMEHGE